MPYQQYRGHWIDVGLVLDAPHQVYRTFIVDAASGAIRHEFAFTCVGFGDIRHAQDEAFSRARAWVEQHPLPWPHAVDNAMT
ncbi:hypothetical protein [Massilia niastensis]|uniref:hypothetical protein n=1 Tax=Massilia niastensis TaxID=544911 RepID=UPI00036C29E8|nr:hypothetical protein [Massilia niastensis]